MLAWRCITGSVAGSVRCARGAGWWSASAAAHKISMTLVLELTDTSLAFLEATLTEQPVFWTAFSGEGKTDWIGARQLVERVGHVDAFAYLILRGVADDSAHHRFVQTCGTALESMLLLEIGTADTVGVVGRRGTGYGREVVVTPEHPWELSACDERVLTDVASVMDVAYDWITTGRLDSNRFELRPWRASSYPASSPEQRGGRSRTHGLV